MNGPPDLTVEVAHGWDRPAVRVPALALLAVVGGLFPSFSLAANLYVLAVGGVLFWLGLSGRVARRPPLHRLSRSAAWWLVPALTLALLELANFLAGSTDAHPTLSLLADPLLDGYLPRATVYFGWLAGFWGLVRR